MIQEKERGKRENNFPDAKLGLDQNRMKAAYGGEGHSTHCGGLPRPRSTLASFIAAAQIWAQQTLPTVSIVLVHLPFSMILFAFPMFILVQALVATGWVPLLAYGWNTWVENTGTVGAIGGMGFLSVSLSSVSYIGSEVKMKERYTDRCYTLVRGYEYRRYCPAVSRYTSVGRNQQIERNI
jgi:hypothetical protein